MTDNNSNNKTLSTGKLVLVIVAVITLTASIMTWGAVIKIAVAKNENRIEQTVAALEVLVVVVEKQAERIAFGAERDSSQAVEYAEIKRDLRYIRKTLEELRDDE